MSILLVTLLLTATDPLAIEDPRGFRFTVPAGFEAFPGFKATDKKLYAFGKDLGTPAAIAVTIDLSDGPVTAGTASASCGKLMNSIDHTIGKPTQERWRGAELIGLRMVMTHTFGEVLVFCVDLPGAPNGLSLMVSGKPQNEAALREGFNTFLSSIAPPSPIAKESSPFSPAVVLAGLVATLFLAWFIRRVRGSASRGSSR